MKRILPLLACLALVATACGSSASGDEGVASIETTSTTSAARSADEVDAEQALLDFTQCLRDQGIDIDDPTLDAEGNPVFGQVDGGDAEFDRELLRAAREECGDLLEDVVIGFGGFDLTELEDTLLEFAQCMRDNGYDMADPDFSNFGFGGGDGDADGGNEGGGRGFGPFGDIDPSDPDFQAASEACSDILSRFGPGRAGGGGRGGSNGSDS